MRPVQISCVYCVLQTTPCETVVNLSICNQSGIRDTSWNFLPILSMSILLTIRAIWYGWRERLPWWHNLVRLCISLSSCLVYLWLSFHLLQIYGWTFGARDSLGSFTFNTCRSSCQVIYIETISRQFFLALPSVVLVMYLKNCIWPCFVENTLFEFGLKLWAIELRNKHWVLIKYKV